MKKKNITHTDRAQFGALLTQEMLDTFTKAYELHRCGESLEALLISFDIFAAGSGREKDDVVAHAHRQSIRSAVEAADLGIPLQVARGRMAVQLLSRLYKELVDEVIDDEEKKDDAETDSSAAV